MSTKTLTHQQALKRAGLPTVETLVRRILRTFDRATAADLEAGARWYAEAQGYAREWAADLNIPLEHCAAVISHLSPRQSWSRNVLAAHEALQGRQWPGTMTREYERARAVLAMPPAEVEDTFGGPKTRRFYRNIMGDVEAVTVDVWAARVAGVAEDKLSRVGVYDAVEHAYRLAARRRGVDPSTMQATTWIVARGGRSE